MAASTVARSRRDQQGKNVADAAKTAGVSSVGGAERGAGITNYFIPAVEKALIGGTLLDAVRADKPYQLICTDDIGAFAALAFAKPERFIGKAIEIAGDELTNPDIAATFGRVMGRPVKFRKLPLLITRIML